MVPIFDQGQCMHQIDRQHMDATLEALARSVRAHYAGSIHSYRSTAASLRALLCDYNRGKDVSLLPRCYRNPQLPAIRGEMTTETTLYIPARMAFDGRGGCVVSGLFEPNPGNLPIVIWLQQPIMDPNTTIKEFIRSVADKEGAHTDEDRGKTLEKSHSVMLGSRHTLTSQFVVAIADIVVDYIVMRHTVQRARAAAEAMDLASSKGRGAMILDLHDTCMRGLDHPELNYVPLDECGSEARLHQLLESYDPAKSFVLGRRALSGATTFFTAWDRGTA